MTCESFPTSICTCHLKISLGATHRRRLYFTDSYSYRYNFADCRADIRWLRFTSNEYIIDPERHRVERLKRLQCMCNRCRGAIHFPPIYPESRRKTHEVEAWGVYGTIDFFPIANVKPRVAAPVKGYTIHNSHGTVRNELEVGHRKFRERFKLSHVG